MNVNVAYIYMKTCGHFHCCPTGATRQSKHGLRSTTSELSQSVGSPVLHGSSRAPIVVNRFFLFLVHYMSSKFTVRKLGMGVERTAGMISLLFMTVYLLIYEFNDVVQLNTVVDLHVNNDTK